ncbi:MAG: cytochrome c oxidase subunit II, partial [Deltaproteobacteria bacterium]
WLGGEREEEGEREKGLALLKEKGCLGCHSIDGSKKIGPTLKGMFGSERIVVRGGEETTVTADEGYIRRALLSPSSEIVKGFPPIMPSQEGRLTDEEIEEILEFLKTLK